MTDRYYFEGEGKDRFLFSLGRNAMYAAFLAAGLRPGDKVLTPAFDCDGTLQPFRAMGLEPVFYRSDPRTFRADISDIAGKLSAGPKMIHVINHFGFPQPWDELLALREKAGIPIMEDNAYSLFSSYKGRPFGSFGDFAIFSLKKNLLLTDGGMLKVNGRYTIEPLKKAPLFYPCDYANVLTMIKRMLGYYKAPEALRAVMRRSNPAIECPPPLYSKKEDGFPEWPMRDEMSAEFSMDHLRPISRLARWQLGRYTAAHISSIAAGKRRYYILLSERLAGVKGVEILWPQLDEGTVPFSFNILLGRQRDSVFGKMRRKYEVMSWPTLPMAVIDRLGEFPDVELLGRGLLQINLAPDKVTEPRFEAYIEGLIKELTGCLE